MRADFPRRGFQFFQVFFDDAGERVLRAGPGFFGFAPFKKRKAGEPQKFPLGLVDGAERFAELQAQLSRDEGGGFGAFDFFFGGDGDDEVAGFCAAGVGEFLYIFRADQFFDRRGDAFRREFDEVNSARADGFAFLG